MDTRLLLSGTRRFLRRSTLSKKSPPFRCRSDFSATLSPAASLVALIALFFPHHVYSNAIGKHFAPFCRRNCVFICC